MQFDYIGFLGGLMYAIALFPQIFKAIKTKSTKDVSILLILIMLIGAILYLVYASINLIPPLMFFATLDLVLLSLLMVLKIKYG